MLNLIVTQNHLSRTNYNTTTVIFCAQIYKSIL